VPVNDYREILMQERDTVLTMLGMKVSAVARTGPVGEEDRAQTSYDEFVSLRLNSLDYRKLRMLNEALRRLDDGEYGICENCQNAIPARRLEVIPWASFCVPCQEQLVQLETEEQTTRGDDADLLQAG
jgi:DnaK suppressor protein